MSLASLLARLVSTGFGAGLGGGAPPFGPKKDLISGIVVVIEVDDDCDG